MSEYCCFEYTATLTATSHGPEGQGTLVHGLVEMRVMTDQGYPRSAVEMEGDVGDLMLFALDPGPCRWVSRSNVWQVDPARLARLGKASKIYRIGASTVHLYAS
jgi:hypothetical protein